MSNDDALLAHYRHGNLLEAIESSFKKTGKKTGRKIGAKVSDITIDDLSAVDEFHLGGREATKNILKHVEFSNQADILDIGCGLGGVSRFIADHYRQSVTGIDLSAEYIETGNVLSHWVGLEQQVNLLQGNVQSMPFPDETFGGAVMFHVGMNIADKTKLFNEIYRVLRSGSFIVIYDIMLIGDDKLSYPVPWATNAETSFLATTCQYKEELTSTGFTVSLENNLRDFALSVFKKQRRVLKENGGLPAIGLHTLIGESAPIKFQNMVKGISQGCIAPVEIIAKKL